MKIAKLKDINEAEINPVKPEKFWAIVLPDGTITKVLGNTENSTIASWIRQFNLDYSWKSSFLDKGYRCVKVTITEGWEQ